MKLPQCQSIRLFTYVKNVAADTKRVNCCYFVSISLSLYCSDPKSALMTTYLAAPWLPQVDILITHCYTCIIQSNLTDLHNLTNNKISHACKSKVTYHGIVMSCDNATSCGNSMSCLVEIFVSTANFGISYSKHLVSSRMSSTCVEMKLYLSSTVHNGS